MKPVFDTVLLRWEKGLVREPISGGGIEKYVEVQGITSPEEARALARDLLDASLDDRTTTAVSGHIWGPPQRPGTGFNVGDFLDGLKVQSISIGIDDEGGAVVTPELGDRFGFTMEEMERRIERANAGVTSEWASPYTEPMNHGVPIDTTVPTLRIELTPPDNYGSG